MAKFKTGDKVKLISDRESSNPMTVETYYIDLPYSQLIQSVTLDVEKYVHCVWRDKNSKVHRDNFHEDMLVKIE